MLSFNTYFLKESAFSDQLNSTWDDYTWPTYAEPFKKYIFDIAKKVGKDLGYDLDGYLQIPIAKAFLQKLHYDLSSLKDLNGEDEIKSRINLIADGVKKYYNKYPDVVNALTMFIQALNKYKAGKDAGTLDFLKEFNPQINDIPEIMDFQLNNVRDIQAYIDDGNKRDTKGQNLVAEDENFKIYKIGNKKQAEAICWKNRDGSSRYCTSQDPDQFVNTYGGYPFFMMTRKLSSGNEKLFGVLMPGMLKKDLSQGIRNASNTGALGASDVREIMPLIQKVSPDSYEYLKDILQ